MNWFDTLWLLQVHNSSSPDLVISPVQLTDAGFYICRVNCGDSFEFSQWAQVDVLNVATSYGETLSFTSQSVHGQHCYYVFLLPGIFGILFLSVYVLIRLTFSTRCRFLLSVKDRQNGGVCWMLCSTNIIFYPSKAFAKLAPRATAHWINLCFACRVGVPLVGGQAEGGDPAPGPETAGGGFSAAGVWGGREAYPPLPVAQERGAPSLSRGLQEETHGKEVRGGC